MTHSHCVRYGKKVLRNFPIDISLQLLSHFKEHLKVYLLCKNKGSNARIKRDTQVDKYGTVPIRKHRKSLERGSSIPTGKFSDFFRPIPAGKYRKLTGIYRKKSNKFP